MIFKAPKRPFLDVTGQRFGSLCVLGVAGTNNKNVYFHCKCDCGREKPILRQNLTSGRQFTCGCIRPQTMHGHGNTPEYHIWYGMLERCNNPEHIQFKNYGGRGILVCGEWSDDVAVFVRDMGPRPSPRHSVDRINNDGNYEPGNCRWATPKQQAKNKRLPKRADAVTYMGRTMSITQWALTVGLKPGTLHARLNRGGWSLEDAMKK